MMDHLHHLHAIDISLQHPKIGDAVNCTDCNQQIYKKNWQIFQHIPTNAHKLNCSGKIRNDNGVIIDDNEVKCLTSVFENRIITYSIENSNEENLIPENFLKWLSS